ncbi:MAG: selenium-dependent xanthine dehydrogenase, partial [Bullifex sp.]
MLSVNGKEYTSENDKKLLSFLRDDLHLTGTKDGCSEGACGACTVIVDGKATRACVFTLSRLQGKKITTIEGLSQRERLVYSYCFASCGAVQCGYCIPGMVMSAKALLDVNLTPTREDVKKAIRGNICRCTGYVKIEDAILLAADYFRTGREVVFESGDASLGSSFARVDAVAKTLGEGIYADDITLKGMCHAKAVRAAYPRARVLSIDKSEAESDPRCVKVITAEDVPNNRHGHLKRDWPVLIAEGELTHYVGDAICLVVAENKGDLDELCAKVKVTYDVLEGVYDVHTALKDEIRVHEGESNVMRKEHIVRGDAKKALEESAHTVHYTFSTPHTEHAFMEPETAVAEYNDGTITVYTGSQSVYDELHEITHILDLPEEKVHCISQLVGGGFGGKEDMSVQHHAALASYITHRPVKVKLSRAESIMIHPKRHPMEMELTLGCDEKGFLTGLECTILADTGAYASLGGPVLQRACTHAAGPYDYQNIDITGIALYTNNVPSGAFRGFGVTQSCFAIESAINKLAEKVDMDPFDFRYQNALLPGDVMPNGQMASGDTAIKECLDALRPYYEKHPGAGIACALKNSGVGVGVPDTGRCILSVEKGIVHIRTSAACMGQGLATVVLQITAETTGLSPEVMTVETPDTIRTPNSGTSTASRQTAFTGEATRRAAEKLSDALKEHTLAELEGQEFYGEFSYETDPITSTKPHPVSHLAYSYSAQLVDLDENGKVREVVAVCDSGRIINRLSAEGQIEGGVIMGLGYALTENFI